MISIIERPYRDGYPFVYLGDSANDLVHGIQIGSVVLWQSQAGVYQQRGTVIGIIPAGAIPSLLFPGIKMQGDGGRAKRRTWLLIEGVRSRNRRGDRFYYLALPLQVQKVIGDDRRVQQRTEGFDIKVSIWTPRG